MTAQGSLYPALYRLEHQALIAPEWGQNNNRRAKFYLRSVLRALLGRRAFDDGMAEE